MTMLRAEGFGHYTTTADWSAKGHNYSGASVSFHPTNGRGGRGCAIVGPNSTVYCVLPTAAATVFAHVSLFVTSRPSGLTNFLDFRSATHSHIFVGGLEDGSVVVYRPSLPYSTSGFLTTGAVLLGTSDPNVWRAGIDNQFQIKAKVSSGSAGEVTILVNGVQVITLIGQLTYGGSGAASVSQVGLGGITNAKWSDLVLCDDQGSIHNTYLGDTAVFEVVSPVDGDELEWTRSTGAGTWSSHVDQNPQVGDAGAYLRSDADGDRVCFSFPTVTSDVGTVVAIKATVCHWKEEAAFGAVALYARSSDDVDHDGSARPSSQTPGFDEKIYPVDPKDDSSWTVAKVNATQLGLVNVSAE